MHFVEDLAQDMRYGLRLLRKNPGFTAVAVLTLALGIGANTAIFSVTDAVLLRPLPVKDPEQLVVFQWEAHARPNADITSEGDYSSGSQAEAAGETGRSFSFPMFQQFSSQTDVFSDVTAMFGTRSVVHMESGHTRYLSAEYVSGNYFQAMGVAAEIGRALEPTDDVPGAPPVAVLGYSKWLGAFGGDPKVIGSRLMLSNHEDSLTVTIVGVASRSFPSIRPGDSRDIWLPGSAQPWLDSERFKGTLTAHRTYETGDDDWWVSVVARLKRGVSLAHAQSAADVLFRNEMFHGSIRLFYPNDAPRIALVPAQEAIVGRRSQFSTPLTILMVVSGVVLLIACANVAGLALARSATRRKEMALRLVLGAGRMRIARQLLTESVMLAAAGGAFGLLLAKWSALSLSEFVTRGVFRAQLDGKVLAFSAAVSALTGIACGLAPAFRGTRVNLTPALNEGSGSTAKSRQRGGRRLSLGNALVMTQLALSMVALTGAGLLVRTLKDLKSVDPGFDTKNILMFAIAPSITGANDMRLQALYSQLQDRISALPGVVSVTHSNVWLLTGDSWTSSFRIEGATTNNRERSSMLAVGPNFFETMRIPILAGRSFTHADFGSVKEIEAAVVNRSFARVFFGKEDPIGRRISGFGGFGRDGMAAEIVGVVGDTRYRALRDPNQSIVFMPQVSGDTFFAVRTAGNPGGLIPAVRDVIKQLAGNLPETGFRTETESIDRNLHQEYLIARLSSVFGMLALLLACVGLYGLLSYEVTRRTREMGIRVALGAQTKDVVQAVVGEGVALAVAGSVIGVGIALGAMRWLTSLLYGVEPSDPLTYAVVAAILILVAAATSYFPARRATRVDPIVALRYE